MQLNLKSHIQSPRCQKPDEQAEDTNAAESKEFFGLLPKGHKKDGCKQIYEKVNCCTFCKKQDFTTNFDCP